MANTYHIRINKHSFEINDTHFTMWQSLLDDYSFAHPLTRTTNTKDTSWQFNADDTNTIAQMTLRLTPIVYANNKYPIFVYTDILCSIAQHIIRNPNCTAVITKL